jgi:hypothetical protein
MFSVQVLQRSSILEVKRQVEQQTGGLRKGWLRRVFGCCMYLMREFCVQVEGRLHRRCCSEVECILNAYMS